MPVIAIGAAVAASVVAGSAVAAVGITVVSALEITAAVGATLGAIGAVTGNKGLATAGTVIGAVGAIGGFAAGAGLLGADAASNAPLFGPAPAAGTADAASAGTVDFVAGDAAPSGLIDAPPAPPGGVGAVDPATGDVITTPVSGADLPPPSPNDTITLASSTQNAADPAAEIAKAPTGAADATAPTGATPLMGGPSDLPTPPQPPSTVPGPGTPPSAAQTPGGWTFGVNDQAGSAAIDTNTSSMFGGLMDFAKKNPVVALGALQAGGSLLSGLSSTLTPAQVSALNAQASANDAAASLTKQQTANLQMPKSVASSAPVTGTPAPLVPQMGMINQPKPAQVTGAPT